MRRIVVIVGLVLAVLGALAIRVVIEGRAAIGEGDEWMERKQPLRALDAYETAARWYLPLAPHVDEAYDRMRALTKSEEPGVAIAAWRAIRGAARASRSLWTPHAEDLAEADEAIAKLSARDPLAGAIAEGATTTADREAWHRARLARDGRPSPGAAALASLGIVLWVSGIVVLVRRGLTPGGVLVRRPALDSASDRRPDISRWALGAGVAIVVGVLCWLVGLYNA